jgi:hypothetical protein
MDFWKQWFIIIIIILNYHIFDQKFGKFFFFNYVYSWLIFWEIFSKCFIRKLEKKTPESWSLWNKYFQNLVVYKEISKKAATMLPNMYDHLGSSFKVYLCEEGFLISC